MRKRLLPVYLIVMCALLNPASQSFANESDDSLRGAYKASELIGKNVKTIEEKDLGEIQDIVIGNEGEVGYAVLSFGGVLGIGDKLFAVPWTSLAHSPDGEYLTLDVEEKKLENAPGFNKDDWPDMQDEQWKLVILEFYQAPQTNQKESVKNSRSLPDHTNHAHFSASQGYLVGGEGKTGNSVRYDGSMIWEGPSYATVDVDPKANEGVVMGIVRTHDHTYTILFTEFNGTESFMDGGIATDLTLHGTSGQGAPIFPKLSTPVAGWGKATVFKDDDVLYKQYPAHFMLTEAGRDEETHQVQFLEPDRLKNFITASSSETSSENMQEIKADIHKTEDSVNPRTLQLHIVAHSNDQDEENIPPYDNFIHFMWDKITWENDKEKSE